jgi:glyoxylase-like metal-dependent hydrolase (beta-lactamase superfamily II)
VTPFCFIYFTFISDKIWLSPIFRRILLDAGEQDDIQYLKRLEDVLKEENIDFEHIIVTHWHHDHIGGVHNVVNRFNNGEFAVTLFTENVAFEFILLKLFKTIFTDCHTAFRIEK